MDSYDEYVNHFGQAEQLLAGGIVASSGRKLAPTDLELRKAQIHATLALAAATVSATTCGVHCIVTGC